MIKTIAQIDKSLEHYFLSYEQNYPVYRFTELIISFESLLGEHIRLTKDERLDVIQKIKGATKDKEGLEELKKYDTKNSAQRTVNRLKKLLNASDEESKQIQSFFYNEDKETGCYRIRNNLLHGNLGLDRKEISNCIPNLNEYLRKALLTILKSYVNGDLNLTEPNYFEELDKFVGL